jgi:hypothetical protein
MSTKPGKIKRLARFILSLLSSVLRTFWSLFPFPAAIVIWWCFLEYLTIRPFFHQYHRSTVRPYLAPQSSPTIAPPRAPRAFLCHRQASVEIAADPRIPRASPSRYSTSGHPLPPRPAGTAGEMGSPDATSPLAAIGEWWLPSSQATRPQGSSPCVRWL